MHTLSAIRIFFILLLFFFQQIGLAQTRTWIVPNTGAWSTTTNWSLNGTPNAHNLIFSGLGLPSIGVTTNVTYTIKSIEFTGSKVYTLSGAGGITFVNPPGTFSLINNSSTAIQTISSPIFFNDVNKYGVLMSKSSGALNLSGAVQMGTGLTQLRFAGDLVTGPITLSAPVASLTGSAPVEIGINENGELRPNTRAIFSGNNSGFSGKINVKAGSLSLRHSMADGTQAPGSANYIEVSNEASIELQGNINLTGKDIYIDGNGIGNNGAIRNVSGNNSIARDIYLSNSSRITSSTVNTILTLGNIGKSSGVLDWNLLFTGAGNIIVNGTIGEINNGATLGPLLKQGAGILTLVGKCFFTENITLSASGKLQLGANNVLPSSSSLILTSTSATPSEFRTGGFSQVLGSLRVTGTANSLITLGAGAHTLRFANSNAETWTAGRILNISGWTGTVGQSGTAGKIFVDPDPLNPTVKGLTDAQLAQIQFLPATTYCQGADILPVTNELVPSTKPFIRTVVGTNSPGGTLTFAGYVGSTITVSGCQFNNANGVSVGTVPIAFNTPTGTPMASALTFTLGNGINGPVMVNTPSPGGANTTLEALTNLGYITKSPDNFWSTGPTWFGNGIPQINQRVTINNANVSVSAPVAAINTGLPLVNPLTINTASSLKLNGDNLLPANTPLVLAGGTLRLYNGNTDISPSAGYNQSFDTLILRNSSKIALGTGAHKIQFAASDATAWTPGQILQILNWQGPIEGNGTAGRVFVGLSDGAGLTANQLKQVQFNSNCPGAIIISAPELEFQGLGELVPSSAPFVTTVTSSPGGNNSAYAGSKVTIGGCNFIDVNKVEVGPVIIPENEFIAKYKVDVDPLDLRWNIEFLYAATNANHPVTVSTPPLPPLNIPKSGSSNVPLVNLGHITKQDGFWNTDPATWLDAAVPLPGKNVTVLHNLTVDGINNEVSTIEIAAGGQLLFANASALTVKANGSMINKGAIVPADLSVIKIENLGTLSNFGTFNSDVFGTVEFLGSGTITGGNPASGLKPIIFNNLIMNSGVLTFPAYINSTNPANFPTVLNEFRINGGSLSTVAGINARGPIYSPNSKLVYSSGANYTRGREWFGTPALNSPSYPFNVIVENGTELNLRGSAGPAPLNYSNLALAGNLIIRKGILNHDGLQPLEIRGDLLVGENESSTGTLRMVGNDSYRHIIIEGNFTINKKSIFDPGTTPINRQPIRITGNKDAILTNLADNPSFYSIEIDKNAEVSLNSTIKILDSLDLKLGVVNTDAANYFQIEGSGLMTGGNNGSFVNGPVRKVTATTPVNASNDFEFKVGGKDLDGNLLYQPVRIANLVHDGSNATSYSAQFNNTPETNALPFPPGPPYIDLSLQGVWKRQWWEITRSGAGTGRVGINYSPLSASDWTLSPNAGTNIAVVRYNNTSWELTEDDGFFNNSTFTYPEELPATGSGWVYSALLDNFSPFSIGWGDKSVLPIQLLTFSASLNNNDAFLQWKVADTKDLDRFEVEHSTDSRSFSKVGTVNVQQGKEYSFRHPALTAGSHYYRLNMIEKDGSRSFSRVELVQMGKQQTIIIGLLQNPVVNQQALVRVFSAVPQSADISLYDLSGRLLLHTKAQLAAGNNQLPVSVLPLRQANYRLRVRTADGVEKTLSLMK